jgi:hypothetical protein
MEVMGEDSIRCVARSVFYLLRDADVFRRQFCFVSFRRTGRAGRARAGIFLRSTLTLRPGSSRSIWLSPGSEHFFYFVAAKSFSESNGPHDWLAAQPVKKRKTIQRICPVSGKIAIPRVPRLGVSELHKAEETPIFFVSG